MNVKNNLAFPLKMQKYSRAEIKERVMEAAKLLRIDNILDSKISSLAGGDRQRVALGRALVRRPKAFLMDEPLGTLDAEFRELMCLELRKLHDDIGATTVYVTHDQQEAMSMADRIAVMNEGEVLQADSPSIIYNKPKSKFVASFIGSPAMNVIHGSQEGANFLTNGAKVKTKVKGQIPKAVAGVRPEDCSVTAPGKGSISGKIFTTELIGDHTLVTVKWGSDQIVVKAHKDFDGKQGDAVGVILPPENLYIFDETNGERIR